MNETWRTGRNSQGTPAPKRGKSTRIGPTPFPLVTLAMDAWCDRGVEDRRKARRTAPLMDQEVSAVTTIKKILCAIDLTKASRNAFDRALSIARVSKARLYVLHAVPANVRFSRHQRERLELLTSLRQRAEREGIPIRTVEQHGDPAGVIVLHANARKADLVVLGSNRRRGWQRFREGSVGERVLRRAAWAVLIVPWDAPSGRSDRNTSSTSSTQSRGASGSRVRSDRV
jgi:nucleotide-binding universal stress UspA family protein